MKSSLLLVLCAAMVISQKDGGGAFGHALSDLEHTQDISPVDGEEGHGIQQAETAKIRIGQTLNTQADEAPADEEHYSHRAEADVLTKIRIGQTLNTKADEAPADEEYSNHQTEADMPAKIRIGQTLNTKTEEAPADEDSNHKHTQQAETDVLAKIRTGQHTKKTSNMKAEADEAPADEEHRDEGENATGKQHTSLSVESLVKAGAASGATVDVKEKQAEETSESSSSSSMSWLYGLAGGVGALCIGTAIALTVYSKRRTSTAPEERLLSDLENLYRPRGKVVK
eukprot:TRINITY_DN3816_c0_g4_i1.p1 TRINITY_DN3816_c0_g4~~TRINITY_DN3816_c0_g4_i1.p1  ORF type:complete len:284 (+),score=81.00 TRINITY_DN3816_c0_g4_i1:70-921(+)